MVLLIAVLAEGIRECAQDEEGRDCMLACGICGGAKVEESDACAADGAATATFSGGR